MIEAVLFDIDNTLILFDESQFFQTYIPRITVRFADVFGSDEFYDRLIGGSRALLQNNGRKINAEYYMDVFCRGVEYKREDFWNRFERFYDTEFDALRELVIPVQGVLDVFGQVREMGLKVGIASHPLWTEQVQRIRMDWAGLDGFAADWITHIENTRFCKPQVRFYREISENIQVPPEKCLMAGNDPVNDMAAGAAGMKTYLVTDASERGFASFPISRDIREQVCEPIPDPDYRGPLSGVPDAVAALLSGSAEIR